MLSTRNDRSERGRTQLLVLALLADESLHGYEIGRRIQERSDGRLTVHVASLYPLLYRLERQRWIRGRWVERAGQRRRRYYRLTAKGRTVLEDQRRSWRELVNAMDRIVGSEHA